MKLYHGTNVDFSEIELSRCRPSKDFGRGFYLTDIPEQARQMAIRRCEFDGEGTPLVQTYEFDEAMLTKTELRVKIFANVSREWAEFILLNRKSRGRTLHGYDIVVGPVADDGVVYQLNLYVQHLITLDQLVEQLTYRKLNRQYYFGTDAAIKLLKRV